MTTAYDQDQLARGPVAYWPGFVTGGTVLTDLSGNGHHVNLTGSYTTGHAAPIVETPSEAVRFTGGRGATADPTSSGYDVDAFTLNAWIKHDAFPDDQRILIRDFLGAIRPFAMYLDWSSPGGVNQWLAQFHRQTAGGVQVLNGPSVPPNAWAMVTMTSDGAHMKIYVNKVLVATAATGVGATSVSDNNIGLGGPSNNTLNYRGYLFGAGLWPYAWTLDDVEDTYDLGVNGPPPPPPPVEAENPPSDYRATITLGDGVETPQVTYVVDSTDPYDGTDPEQVLDGMTFGWTFPTGQPWPSQPDPEFCNLRLLALDAATLRDIAVEGCPVAVVLTDTPGGGGAIIATFHGRVSTSAAAPVRRPSGNRTLFSLSCVGYLVDLSELTIRLEARPAESIAARVEAIRIAMVAAGSDLTTGIFGPGPDLDAQGAKTTDALSALTDTLRQYNGLGGPGTFRRFYIRARVAAPGDVAPTTPELATYGNEVDSVLMPGLMVESGGILGITFPPAIGSDVAGGVVDGARVPFDSLAWRNGKRRAVSRVTVTGPTFGVYTLAADSPRVVKLELSTTLTGSDIAASGSDSGVGRMAAMYLPDPAEASGWEAQALGFLASGLLDQLPVMFPDSSVAFGATAWPMGPVVVTDVPDEINLAGPTGVYAGLLQGAALTVQRGRVNVEFSLRRRLPEPRGNQAKTASFDYIQAAFPTIDFDHVDPTLTPYVARLARKA